MKKTLYFAAVLTMLLSLLSVQSFAADSVTVNVTISDGSLVMAHEAVNVDDVDGDGIISLNDALCCAHESKFPGGASAGYGSVKSEWGISLTKLWGIDNGGSYGYFINNASAMSLNVPVKDNDYISAYVYTDLNTYSDAYCYFNTNAAAAGNVSLTLSKSGFDENWNPIVLPVEGAVIFIDGKETAFITDASGNVNVEVSEGSHIISAKSSSEILVPPVCIVAPSSVLAPQTGDSCIMCVYAAFIAAVFIMFIRRKSYEN